MKRQGVKQRVREPAARRKPSGGGEAAATAPQLDVTESPLAWLFRRRGPTGGQMLTDEQFEAGERFRRDYEIGQLMPRVTVDWQRIGSGGGHRRSPVATSIELSDRAVAARERVNRAITAVGPELANALIEVCCHLKGLEQLERECRWPKRSGKLVLQLALQALVRHYGLDRRRVCSAPPKVRHWGASGYRPTIGDEEG